MKKLAAAILALIMATALAQAADDDICAKVACRERTTVRVRLDPKHYTEVSFKRMPWTDGDAIYLVTGESFSIQFKATRDAIGAAEYRPGSTPGPDSLELGLSQQENGFTTLSIKNGFGRRIAYKCVMLLPGDNRMQSTRVLPIEPGLTNFESWQHPVAQLILYDVHYQDK